jgi:hypothetical protein
MRSLPRLSVLLLCLGVGLGRAHAADPFVAGIEDMPLMPGLTQLAERNVVFDAPSGRIVEAYAEGQVGREAVRSFYARTLPQLGWHGQGSDRYVREGETLRIEFPDARPGGSRVLVRFFLSPG